QFGMGDRGAVDLGFEQGQLHGVGPWGGGQGRDFTGWDWSGPGQGTWFSGPSRALWERPWPRCAARHAIAAMALPRHPDCLRRWKKQKLAAEAAPTRIPSPLSDELEIVDQARGPQPGGDEGDALARSVVRLGQHPVAHHGIVDHKSRGLEHRG